MGDVSGSLRGTPQLDLGPFGGAVVPPGSMVEGNPQLLKMCIKLPSLL